MWDMMLRSKISVADINGGVTKRKMSRSKKVIQVHVEGRSTEEQVSSVVHSGTSLASSSSDCISNTEQLSSLPEHSATCRMKNNESLEVGKCSSAVIPSSTTSHQVLSNSDQSADLQSSSLSEDCTVVRSSKSSRQMLSNSTQTVDLLPSSVLEDSVRSLKMEDSTEISDVSVLEIKSLEPSYDSNSADADTSDVIIISDSPGKGSVGKATLKTASREVSQLQQGRKRKISDESGVEILCDTRRRPKKQKKIECAIKDKKLRTNNSIKKKFTVTVSGTNSKISQPTTNEKTEDVITSKQASGEDDVIVIGADDDEVSIINTKEESKPPQEDVIVLDSPPAHSSTVKKSKKSVSASVTGLIPHYTQHLIDYISLDGRPPASSSSSSSSTPQLPAANGDRTVTHEYIPVLRRQYPANSRRPSRYDRARRRLRNHINAHNSNSNIEPASVSVPLCTFPPHTFTENQVSCVRNSTENYTAQNSAGQNSTFHNSTSHNSTSHICTAQNSTGQNSTAQNCTGQNSTAQNSTTQNAVPEISVPENSVQSAPEVSQSPACSYGSNIYNPNAKDKEETGLRPIILDGNNVAMGHGKGKFFSWKGLHICIKFFLKRGHNVTAFVPTFRRGVCPPELRSEMDEYEKSGQVVFTPSRRIEGRLVVPYDDRFIVQCAAELGGVIVSTDNFRDLLTENNTWKETIEKRLLMFTWVGDLLMFPHDPLGKHGPQLEEFLRFPKK